MLEPLKKEILKNYIIRAVQVFMKYEIWNMDNDLNMSVKWSSLPN